MPLETPKKRSTRKTVLAQAEPVVEHPAPEQVDGLSGVTPRPGTRNTMITTEPAQEPTDPLTILRECADHLGLLHVVVMVSHDAVFAGQHIRVPVTERVAGLVERGFLDVEIPGDDG
jgi:hypothetical protein